MWFKVDDKFHAHRKVAGSALSMSARGLWVTAASWSCDQLTDGFVPTPMLRQWGGTMKQARELVRVGLWTEVDGGFRFHEWADHQPSGSQVRRRREAERERKRRQRSEPRPARTSGGRGGSVPPGHGAESVRTRGDCPGGTRRGIRAESRGVAHAYGRARPEPEPDPVPELPAAAAAPIPEVGGTGRPAGPSSSSGGGGNDEDPHVLGSRAARIFDEEWARQRGHRLGLHSGHSGRGCAVWRFFASEGGGDPERAEALLRRAAAAAAAQIAGAKSPWAVFAGQPGRFLHGDPGSAEEQSQRADAQYEQLRAARAEARQRGDEAQAEAIDRQIGELIHGPGQLTAEQR